MDRKAESRSLDSVTDYHEEKELDASKAQAAMSKLGDEDSAKLEEKKKREKELAHVKVSASDTKFMVEELEIAPSRADRLLRECKNDVVAAIRLLLTMKASELANDNFDLVM